MHLYYLFPLFLGLITGSFLSMLIYRLPRNIKLLSPHRSFCPNCKKKISLFENIPIVSFIFLKGRCSGCNCKISWTYPLVEFTCAAMSLILFPSFLSPDQLMEYFFKYTIFASFLVHLIVDFKHKILPDSINMYLAVVFLFHSILYHSWTYWVGGGLIGYLFPLLVTWIFYKIRGIRGMGMGDIKLFAALGIYLGIYGIIYNIFLSCFLGSIVGIILLSLNKMKKEDAIAFGPYIIIVATFQIFFERQFNQLINFIFS